MPESKSASQATAKWKNRTAVATEDYRDGVTNPRTDWQQATQQAEDTWKAAIADAATKGRFGKGVSAAGTAKWKAGAATKGADRYAPGVAQASDEYQQAMQSVISTIESVNLPKRYPKGDPRNIERVKAIALALHKSKSGG